MIFEQFVAFVRILFPIGSFDGKFAFIGRERHGRNEGVFDAVCPRPSRSSRDDLFLCIYFIFVRIL